MPPAEHKVPTAPNRKEKPKKKKWPAAGLIFCEREQNWCANVDTNNGRCRAEKRCPVHDPEYIARQKEIMERMQFIHLRDIGESEREEDSKQIAEKHRKEHIARQEYIRRGVPMPENLRKKINDMQGKTST